MKTERIVKFAVVLLAAGVGLTAPLGARPSAAGTTPAVSKPANLYVDSHAVQCYGADGSPQTPFCTISAAAAVVSPGQTVHVEPGVYDEAVTFTRSGTSSTPITFVAENSDLGQVNVGSVTQTVTGTIFNFPNVHDVVVRGFFATGGGAPVVLVNNSARITLDGDAVQGGTSVGVEVTGASSDVTISRTYVADGRAAAIQIDPGSARTQVSENTLATGGLVTADAPGLSITDAPGTTVSGNTFVTWCSAGITVAGTSPGVSIQNNIVETAKGAPTAPSACANPAAATAITVSDASIPQTVADYNLIDPASTGAPYTWGSVSYSDLPSFQAATGQGGHDIAANPGLQPQSGSHFAWYPISATSPAVDSANADAPGELTTDLLDNARADDPDVANTGTGNGYYDRGAAELEGVNTAGGATLSHTVGGAPFEVTATVMNSTSWVTNGPVGEVGYLFNDGSYAVITKATSVQHTLRKAGLGCATIMVSQDGFRTGAGSSGSCTVLGAYYTPVTPTRILDTRTTTGVSSPAPIPPNSNLFLNFPGVGALSAGDISAVVLNVTVTDPTAGGYLTVYSSETTMPLASNLNFNRGQTVPNLVTVPLVGGSIVFHNGSAGTVNVVADLAGFYSAGGSGFKAQTPVRVMDTRDGTGTGTARPIGPLSALPLDLSGRVPAGATAVILNVTVTAPTAAAYLTVYPDGGAPPLASNLNFTAGQTVPNLVMVPINNGKVDFYNGSSGTVHVVADLAGYFGTAASGATQVFVPDGPVRITDTRYGTSVDRQLGQVPPYGQLSVSPIWFDGGCVPSCPRATAAVLNVTVTAPNAPGYLTVYPAEQPRPLASNLNFNPFDTVPNLVAVPDTTGVAIYNGSSGGVDVVVDEEGYFIDAPS